MNDVQLIERLEKWLELKKDLDLLEFEIKREVSRRGETVKVSGVEAEFIKPEKVYDYESAVNAYDGEIDVEQLKSANSKIAVNWYRVSTGLGIDRSEVAYKEKPARVTIKLR